MRKVTVPIDMSSEQKAILGIISKRQLIYLIAGGALLYAYIPIVFKVAPNFFFGVIMCLISSLPIIIATIILGFLKHSKYSLYYDRYLIIKLGYKSQIGVWRKGAKNIAGGKK